MKGGEKYNGVQQTEDSSKERKKKVVRSRLPSGYRYVGMQKL